MADEKITVSWDDLTSRKVERRLKEQDALARNRDYANITEASLPQPAPAAKPSALTRLWRNSLFALALFGLIGGVLAWVSGASLEWTRDVKADADAKMRDIHRLTEAAEKDPTYKPTADLAIAGLTEVGRRENPYFAILTDPDPALRSADAETVRAHETLREQRLAEVLSQERLKALIRNILGYGLSGVLLALFLAIAIPVTEGNGHAAIINGAAGAALGLIGGICVALLVPKVFIWVAVGPEGQTSPGRQILGRVAVWGMMGLFLTVAPGIVMRNWRKFATGLLGGLIGGVVGGVLYDPIVSASHGSVRFNEYGTKLAALAAMSAIGLIAGLATGLIENAAKTGWLRVTQGLIAGKQFILYRNPTFVGSGPDCQIYLFKDPKVGRRHAAIHIVPGGFELEDLPLGDATYVNGRPVTRARLKNGDRVQIGGTCLVFQEKATAA